MLVTCTQDAHEAIGIAVQDAIRVAADTGREVIFRSADGAEANVSRRDTVPAIVGKLSKAALPRESA